MVAQYLVDTPEIVGLLALAAIAGFNLWASAHSNIEEDHDEPS